MITFFIQLLARPYRTPSDQFLAVVAWFAVVVCTACCAVFQYNAQFEVQRTDNLLSREQLQKFVLDSSVLAVIVFAAILLTIP